MLSICVTSQNNLKELHGFETQAKDLFTKPLRLQNVGVDFRLAAESIKAEVRFRRILHQRTVGILNQVFDPVTFEEEKVHLSTQHLGIPSPPQGKRSFLY